MPHNIVTLERPCRGRCRRRPREGRRAPGSGAGRPAAISEHYPPSHRAADGRMHAWIAPGRVHGNASAWLICGYRYWRVAGVLSAISAGGSAESRPLFGRRRRRAGVRWRPACRNMHAYQPWFRQECAFGPLCQAQSPALRRGQMLLRDRHGHLPLADGPHSAAGQRCPVVVNRIGLRRARDRQLVSAKSFRAAFRCRNVGNRMRCRIYRVGAPRRESAYDAQQRNRHGLAEHTQNDHPLSTLPASGGNTAFRGGTLRYCRPPVTHFLLTGGKAWPLLT